MEYRIKHRSGDKISVQDSELLILQKRLSSHTPSTIKRVLDETAVCRLSAVQTVKGN